MAVALLPLALALAAPDYPLAAVLDAARETCAPVTSLAAYERSLPAQGWARYVPDAGSWLASYIAGNEDMGAATVTHRTYTREVAGRPLIAYVAMLEMDLGLGAGPSRALSCEVFDLTAAGAITAAAVQSWAKRKPKSPGAAADSVLLRWSPGLTRGSDETSITYVPAESGLAAQRRGLAYTVTATLPKGAK